MSSHDDHALPPPEVDNVDAVGVTFWGVASFISLLVSIFAMTSYFWLERVQEDTNKVHASAYFSNLQNAQTDLVKDRLAGVKPLWQVAKKNRTEGMYNSLEAAKQKLISGGPDAINGRSIRKADQFQIPVEHAMKLVIKERARHFDPPKPVATAKAAPAAPAKPPAAFNVDDAKAKQGAGLFKSKNCATCHSIDGSRLVGPTMKGIWGRKEKMQDGTELYVDRAYFVRSVKAPMDQIVAGYPAGMLQIELSDDEIDALLHYVASLK